MGKLISPDFKCTLCGEQLDNPTLHTDDVGYYVGATWANTMHFENKHPDKVQEYRESLKTLDPMLLPEITVEELMKIKGVVYVASPYTHSYSHVVQARYDAVIRITGLLIKEGITAYSPIIHGHAIRQRVPMGTNWETWAKHCAEMLMVCKLFLVCPFMGYSASVGIKAELEIAQNHSIPSFIFKD